MNEVKNPVWEQLKEEAVNKLQNNKELLGKNGAKKWMAPMHHWGEILSQLSIIFGNRLKLDLSM